MSLIAKRWRWAIGLVAVLGVSALLFLRGGADGAAPAGDYETIVVDRGVINQSVATSGSVRPLVTVQVGSQLSGQVAELFADFNSEVSAGELIARIDPQTFETRVEAARADREVANATLNARRADRRRAQAFVEQRKSDLDRFEGLGEEAGLAEVELDALRAQYQAALADLDAAVAQIENAKALVIQRQAALEQAEVDLGRTEIRSPIDGVVIQRNVDVGQTVAASLSAPVLFEIAQDLSRVQIEADVNEADIGAVAKDNAVTFTVDAYPGRSFSGSVESVRLAPTELQNVVTYTVIIHAANPGRVLYPGMTATVEIVTGRRDDVLRIPNAGARFEPANAAELRANLGEGGGQRGGGGRMSAMAEELGLDTAQQREVQSKMRELFSGGGGPGGLDPQERRKRVRSIMKSVLTDEQFAQFEARAGAQPQFRVIWVLNENSEIEPRRIRLGLADNSFTEVAGGDLQEGDAVIVRATSPQS